MLTSLLRKREKEQLKQLDVECPTLELERVFLSLQVNEGTHLQLAREWR